MKFFTAILFAAAIATHNVAIAQTDSNATVSTTGSAVTVTDIEDASTTQDMSSNTGDLLVEIDGTASSGETPMLAGSGSTSSGSGNGPTNVGDESAASSGAVSIQSITLTASTLVAGLAAALFY